MLGFFLGLFVGHAVMVIYAGLVFLGLVWAPIRRRHAVRLLQLARRRQTCGYNGVVFVVLPLRCPFFNLGSVIRSECSLQGRDASGMCSTTAEREARELELELEDDGAVAS